MAGKVEKATMPISPTPRTPAAGFTLLEMLLVLTVLAMAAGIAAPRLTRLPERALLQSESSAAIALLGRARLAAISSNRPVAAAVNVQDMSIEAAGKRHVFDDGISLSLRTGASLMAGPAVGRIVFYPDGSNSGGLIEIIRGGAKRIVRIDWLSGRIGDDGDA